MPTFTEGSIVAAGVALVSALLAIRMPREATVTATERRQPESDRSPVERPATPAPERVAA